MHLYVDIGDASYVRHPFEGRHPVIFFKLTFSAQVLDNLQPFQILNDKRYQYPKSRTQTAWKGKYSIETWVKSFEFRCKISSIGALVTNLA